MADETRRASRRRETGGTSTAYGTATGTIGEAEADAFAGDVVGAGGEEIVADHLGGGIAGAAGGGTGAGDLAGGTGIGPGGTDDIAGNEGPGMPGGGGR